MHKADKLRQKLLSLKLQSIFQDHIFLIQSEPTNNTASTCGTKSDSVLRKESLLFGDDCGISNPAKRKSNNRVRTHRRTTRKKAAQWDKGQGSLFETYETSQSAA